MCPYCGHVAEETVLDPHVLRPGTILNGRYLLGLPLGQGGFGITYIGRDLKLNMRVAVKEYYPSGWANRNADVSSRISITSDQPLVVEGMNRFLKEAQVLAHFHDTPGVVEVRDYFEANNTAYIVMEYLEGEDLAHKLKKRKFSSDEIFTLMKPIFTTLEKIHQQGIIHRDISPDNIMMLPDGSLKLMDFGAARLMNYGDQRSLSVVLKAGYAPKEQYSSKGSQGPWTDVYALCATIYKCITGITPDDALDRADEDDLKWPSELGFPISVQQEAVLKKGMEIRQRDRFQSIGELKDALRKATSGGIELDAITTKPARDDATVAIHKEPEKDDTPKEIVKAPAGDLSSAEEKLSFNDPKEHPNQTTIKKKPILFWLICAALGVAVFALALILLLGGKGNQPFSASPLIESKSALPSTSAAPSQQAISPNVTTPAPTISLSPFAAQKAIAAGRYHTVGLKEDGTVVAVGKNEIGQCDVSSWQNIVAVATGWDSTFGLRSDGTVMAVGDNGHGQCDVSDWKDIVDIAAGWNHTVGLKSDGTVVAVGDDTYGQCDVSGWSDIVTIAAGDWFTIGLRQDGSVVATGFNANGECDVSAWTDIVDIAAGGYHTVGLRSDGTMVAAATGGMLEWRDIAAIAAGGENTFGIRTDGTVIATGNNSDGQCDVSDWTDIVAVAAHADHTIGLKADGTVVATGWNGQGRCDVSDWKDIRVPAAQPEGSFVMPDLAGMTIEEADHILSLLGLKRGEITEEHSDTCSAGQIIRHTAESGEKVCRGDSVSFVVAIKDPSMYRFHLGVQEKGLYDRVKAFVDEAKGWEKQSDCPQTIDQVPLLPAGFLSLYDELVNTESVLLLEGNAYVWHTNASAILPEMKGTEEISCSYCSYQDPNDMNVYDTAKLDKIDKDLYSLPTGISIQSVENVYIYRTHETDFLNESIHYSNDVKYGETTDLIDLSVDLQDMKSYSFIIMWARGINRISGKDYLGIEITLSKEHRDCYLTYDIETGMLADAAFRDF